MIAIPLSLTAAHYDLFLVFEHEDMERIKAYDPADISTQKFGEQYRNKQIRSIVIMFATKEEMKRLADRSNTLDGLLQELKQLARGWKYQPDKGDNDLPYQNVSFQ